MHASLDPTADVPIVLAASGEFHRSASMCTHRDFDLGGQRILVLVDHVLVDREVHDLVDPRLFPGLAEGCEILAGVAVEKQFVLITWNTSAGKLSPSGNWYFGIALERSPRAKMKSISNADVISSS